jgi:hypothetical protein
MEYSDKINMIIDFADGTLDPGEEDQLFLLLSSDEELRQIFKSHISIKNSIHTGAGNIAQPTGSKAAVFSAVGLDLSPASEPVPNVSDRRFYTATGVSIILTTLLLLFLNSDNQESDQYEITKFDIRQNITQMPLDKTVKRVIPSVSSVKIKGRTAIANNTYGDKYQPSGSDIFDLEDIAATETERVLEVNSDLLNISETDISTNDILLNKGKVTEQENYSFGASQYYPLSSGISIKGINNFSIEFRGSSYRGTQPPTISPKEYSPLNNLALAISYNVNKNFSVGIDVRQETFFLRYKGTDNGKEFIYEQQPNFTTFSGTVKYKLDGWSDFRPFGQVSAGMNSIGLVGRAMLGAEYRLFGNFSMMIGFDFNNLTYSYQNNYFNSSKFGLNYGLIYSF